MSESVASLTELLRRTADEMKRLADPSLAIGQPMVIDGATVIPVSKASFGVAGGGADTRSGSFGGGAGGKAELTPLAFLVIRNGQVQVVQAEPAAASAGLAGAAAGAAAGLLKKAKEKKPKEKK